MNEPFLNVTQSLSGRRWIGPDAAADRAAEAVAQGAGLPLPLARVLAARGVAAPDAARYLRPALRDLLPDPRSLRDIERAAARLLGACETRQAIAIFADYDVDGGASAALLMTWLRAMGHRTTLYIPDRIEEGYGPNTPAMAALAQDHRLILCVDCGTLSHEPVAAAKGADVVILDHHLAAPTLPPAYAVVNPNRQDEDGSLGHLCAAAVVFLLLVEANRQLRAKGQTGPDLMAMLDLVALATVADVAPLVGVNRAFVRQGLRVMAGRDRVGLRALADVARLDRAPTAYHLGFLLGPRINAGGRVGAADLGARLLATDDPAEAQRLARQLDALNGERRQIEAAVRDAALAQATARGVDGPLVWAAGEGWHPGVVGIVAARLAEATQRPSVVIGLDGGIGKGSARSVPGIDLGAAIHRLADEGLLLRGGGHKAAAGLTLTEAQLGPAMDRLGVLLGEQGAGAAAPRDLRIDGLVMPGAVSAELVDSLDSAGPYGAAAPAPRFAFAALAVTSSRPMGGDHLSLRLAAPGTGPTIEAVAFNALQSPLGQALRQGGANLFHVAGRIEMNTWNGRSTPRLRIDDAAIAR